MLSTLLLSGHEFIGVNAFLFVALILSCLLIGGLIKRYKITFLPESAAFMIFGFICGAFMNLTSAHEKSILEFSPELIFFVILPPIILDAGYTLKRKDFFHNLGTILMLAVVGTVLNCIVFGYLMYGFAKAGWVPLDSESPLESLLFGAVVSATDPVATLAMLGSKEVGAHPLLYSLVFGESVLNDAIAIVLYKTFDAALPGGGSEGEGTNSDDPVSESHFGVKELLGALGTFIGVSLGSLVVGVGVALLCCFIFKKVDLSHFPIYEFTLVTLFAYLSYFMAEMLYLSGIMSIFFCSVCLAHYNYYNISTNAQIATQESFKSIAQICECFVFAYIGITGGLSIASSHLEWSVPLIILTIVSCLIARACNVFPLCTLANTRRNGGLCKSGGMGQGRGSTGARISYPMMVPLWFAGLRGAVAFALSLSFGGEHVKFVVSSTLMLVLFTTIVGGGLTLPILKWSGMALGPLGLAGASGGASRSARSAGEGEGAQFELLEGSGPSDGQDDDDGFVGGHGDEEEHKDGGANGHSNGAVDVLARESSHKYSGLIARFKHFDKQYMRVWFGGAQTARGKSTGLIDEYGAPVLLAGDNPSMDDVPLHGHEGMDPELVVRTPVAHGARPGHGVAHSVGGTTYLQLQPRYDPASPATMQAVAGLAAPLGAVVPAYVYPSPTNSAAAAGTGPSATTVASSPSSHARPGRFGDAGLPSPHSATYRQDEDELKSIFNNSGGTSGAVPVRTGSAAPNAVDNTGGAYVPPSFNRDSAVASPPHPALMQDEEL